MRHRRSSCADNRASWKSARFLCGTRLCGRARLEPRGRYMVPSGSARMRSTITSTVISIGSPVAGGSGAGARTWRRCAMVVDLPGGADRRARICARWSSAHGGNGRRQAVDLVDVRLLHVPGIAARRPAGFRHSGAGPSTWVVSKASETLSNPGKPGEEHWLVARNVEIDVLEVCARARRQSRITWRLRASGPRFWRFSRCLWGHAHEKVPFRRRVRASAGHLTGARASLSQNMVRTVGRLPGTGRV